MAFHGVYFFPLLKYLMALYGIYLFPLLEDLMALHGTYLFPLFDGLTWHVFLSLCLSFQNLKPYLRDPMMNEKDGLEFGMNLFMSSSRIWPFTSSSL